VQKSLISIFASVLSLLCCAKVDLMTCSFRVSLLFDLSIKLLSELMILSSALMNSRFAADFDLRERGKFQFATQ